MQQFTIDTILKLFIAKPGVTAFSVQTDLYSDAKEDWVASDSLMGFEFPMRSVAGDPRADGSIIEPFYFLRDGWKIRPDEIDHTLTVTGNLDLDAGEGGGVFVPTLGGYTVMVVVNATNRGTINPVEIPAEGLTAEQHTWLQELYDLTGLRLGMPLVVSKTSRQAGAISQTISEVSQTVTVERT
jgi:hypothetical protein